jgi:hypothetical protein
MRRATLPFALALAVLFGTARAGAQGGCTITADPSPGWPGANVTARGEGFTPGADITVALGFFPVYDGFVDASGRFEIAFKLPSPFEPGPTELRVADHTGGCDASLAYAIGEQPQPDPAIQPWGLAVLVAAGAALGIGIAGVGLRRRRSASSTLDSDSP